MKVLITGVSGNVGYFLAKYLVSKKVPVIGIDLEDNGLIKNSKYFKFLKADVTDIMAIKDIFWEHKPTHVIHLAYLMKSIHYKKKEHDIDVNGTVNVMAAANSTKSVRQFLEFSSASAYGAYKDNKPWIKENRPLNPGRYRYGIFKKEAEDKLTSFKKRPGLKLVTVRMCTAVGPDEHKKGGLVELVIKSPFLLKFNGRYCDVQFIHQYDLQRLTEMILKDKSIQGVYNLTPDSYCSIKDLVPGKKFINLPVIAAEIFAGIAWHLRLSNIHPASIKLSAYGIVISPEKLIKRLNYKFKYSALSAFKDSSAAWF
ncbi:MAG TPA: NAD(P)-dependent oxidoreductase [Candidatus Goldiibacteriota bacterium]|nr:NAD(P)-dependent oxidoreductase [Candidatus Goldiibacteriota bacterium]HPI04276.1 NAD(P)-dependent oxidoreductase [Candidatus Goldiibacteriota bacterium]HPN65448.1 NAD(P)-dependent oxidoreductase [Candidatus Goldiibacteriota bacterium]HRQ44332.1 NAD(P)-dependent oxidoreductase [Candidatus Goldiibacteriota bacterium]